MPLGEASPSLYQGDRGAVSAEYLFSDYSCSFDLLTRLCYVLSGGRPARHGEPTPRVTVLNSTGYRAISVIKGRC